MALTRYHNLSGATAVNTELLAPGDGASNIRSITITNTHASAVGTLSLLIQDNPASGASSTYYLIKKIKIPVGASLLINDKGLLSFDNSTGGFGLYSETGATDTFDVIISL